MVKTKPDVHIRWAVRADMLEVLDIERESFEHPWTEDDFLRILRQRNVIAMVAEANSRIVGYMVYELGVKKLYLHNIAVATKGIGIGRGLIEKLMSKLSPQGKRNMLECHVRETNIDACNFFKAMGWRASKIVPDFYEEDETTEDAYLFSFRVKAKGQFDE